MWKERETMTVNKLLEAAAVRLGELFPGRHVFADTVKNHADGNFYIRCVEQSHTKRLGRRRDRAYSFEILYFLKSDDPFGFNEWAETMYSEFETVTADGHVFHVSNAHAEDGDDMVFHFVYDVVFSALYAPETENSMGGFTLAEGLKND